MLLLLSGFCTSTPSILKNNEEINRALSLSDYTETLQAYYLDTEVPHLQKGCGKAPVSEAQF